MSHVQQHADRVVMDLEAIKARIREMEGEFAKAPPLEGQPTTKQLPD